MSEGFRTDIDSYELSRRVQKEVEDEVVKLFRRDSDLSQLPIDKLNVVLNHINEGIGEGIRNESSRMFREALAASRKQNAE